MKLRTTLFLSFFIAIGVIFGVFIRWVSEDFQPRSRAAVEDSLVDAAELIAGVLSQSAQNNVLSSELIAEALQHARSRELNAQIYDLHKTKVGLRVYVTDENGKTVYNSEGAAGEDYSEWRDVRRALTGEYGARTTRDIEGDPSTTVLYVAAPILVDGAIIGAVTLGKPALQSNTMVDRARRRLVTGALLTILMAALLLMLITYRVTLPLARLRDYAKSVRDGDTVARPPVASGEIGEVTMAFEEMREALEGRKYVEQYVQTLTHELKSPIASVAAAAELLEEHPEPEQAARFVKNIRAESARMQSLVEKLLQLAALERHSAPDAREKIDLGRLVREVARAAMPGAEQRNRKLSISVEGELIIHGDERLLALAISNLIENALEFSPPESQVDVQVLRDGDGASVIVRDRGPGIPDFAIDRVFERFYSLPRPESGRKSSGLGLSMVKEIAARHGATVHLHNESPGLRAVLRFPLA
ncbi:MAG: two-component system sensor histidine kinase CreC [Deltaproteobacteria bacterium]|nr:two-component system sensor histidine kinase CreC [Deltaproteobacteria bacterium]